jgi:hypothetical protein
MDKNLTIIVVLLIVGLFSVILLGLSSDHYRNIAQYECKIEAIKKGIDTGVCN